MDSVRRVPSPTRSAMAGGDDALGEVEDCVLWSDAAVTDPACSNPFAWTGIVTAAQHNALVNSANSLHFAMKTFNNIINEVPMLQEYAQKANKMTNCHGWR